MNTKLTVMTAVALLVAGCGTTGDYKAYIAAQQQANAQSAANRKPLVLITAEPGQPIIGLSRIEVYTPEAAPVIQQARPSEWASVVNNGLSILGTLGGIKLGGDAAIGAIDAVGKAANYGYQFVNPTPVIAPEVQVVRPEVVQVPAPEVVQLPAPEVIQLPPPEVIQVPTPFVQ